MKLLNKTKKETNSTEDKFFGAYISEETYGFIALYTEAHGITKTDVLREMTDQWLKKTMDESSVEDLTSGLTVKILKRVDALKHKKHYNMSKIMIDLHNELCKKGIFPDLAEQIVSSIKQTYEKRTGKTK